MGKSIISSNFLRKIGDLLFTGFIESQFLQRKLCDRNYDKIANEVKNMSQTIEAVFDGAVFRPDTDVKLEPNTRVEITVTVKSSAKEFRVKSKPLGFRKDLDYDKTSELLEQIEGARK